MTTSAHRAARETVFILTDGNQSFRHLPQITSNKRSKVSSHGQKNLIWQQPMTQVYQWPEGRETKASPCRLKQDHDCRISLDSSQADEHHGPCSSSYNASDERNDRTFVNTLLGITSEAADIVQWLKTSSVPRKQISNTEKCVKGFTLAKTKDQVSKQLPNRKREPIHYRRKDVETASHPISKQPSIRQVTLPRSPSKALKFQFSFAKSATNSISRAMDYWTSTFLRNNASVCAIFGVRDAYSSIAWMFLKNEACAHIWLADVYLKKAAQDSDQTSTIDAYRHMSSGLRAMHATLSEAPFESLDPFTMDCLIGSTLFLAYISQASCESTGADLHFRNLSTMIQFRGGLTALGFDGALRAILLQREYFSLPPCSQFEADDSAKPYHFPRYPQLTSSSRDCLRALPDGFQNLIESCLVSERLLPVLSRINSALEHKLDSTQSEYDGFWEICGVSGPDQGFALDQYLLLTLIIFVQKELAPVPQCLQLMSLYTRPRSLLISSFHRVMDVLVSASQYDCLAWIWMVLVDSLAEGRTSMAHMLERKALFIQLSTCYDRFREIELDEVLGKFFSSKRFRKVCKLRWQILETLSIA